MKIKVEVDLEDFMDNFSGEALDKLIAEEIQAEIMKKVKQDTRYKAHIQKQTEILLSKLGE